MSYAVTDGAHWGWWGGVAVAMFLMVLIGTVPGRYAAEPMLAYMLPTVHKLLALSPTDRVVVHHLKSSRSQTYEQLTEYYPTPKRPSRGRVFHFSHGIVGQCFKTVRPQSWAVPDGKEFDEAMATRWSFSEDELRRVTPDRRSFFAYPLGQEGAFARAVLYLDSDSAERFSDAAADRHRETIRDYFLSQLTEALRYR